MLIVARPQIQETPVSPVRSKFIIEPLEPGFGYTLGNSLRRILLSSLEGAAAISVKIAGVEHEFARIEGVMEDVTDIILNVKSLIVKLDSDDIKEMKLTSKKSGAITAGMIEADSAITIGVAASWQIGSKSATGS